MIRNFFIVLLVLLSFQLSGQVVYQHVRDNEIYSFLDELANLQIIELNSSIKPYSRKQIECYLSQANNNREKLNKHQIHLLEMYQYEFSLESTKQTNEVEKNLKISLLPPKVDWKDTLFSIRFRPIYGIQVFQNKTGQYLYSFGGAEVFGYYGKNWGAYISLRDNYQKNQVLTRPSYFVTEEGGNFKNLSGTKAGGEYSEMRGGIVYSWNWGNISFIKDHIIWGDSKNGSNILSGRTPSFPMLKLNIRPVDWFSIDYFHAWLVSEVIDSTRSYYTQNGDFRAIYREKNIAANMISIRPFKRLYLSFGNSIVYSDRGTEPAYLFPLFFYKSIDHTLNNKIENQNSQMFINISSRQIRHMHLYLSLFIDEFSIKRIGDPLRNNFTSFKSGINISSWPLRFINYGFEYTRNSPLTYKHRVETLTFESNKYNLGHYLRDNSEEFFSYVDFSIHKYAKIRASYCYAWHGNEYPYLFQGVRLDQLPFLKEKSWDKSELKIEASCFLFKNTVIKLVYLNSLYSGYDLDDKNADYYLSSFTPEYLHGKNKTIYLSFKYGF